MIRPEAAAVIKRYAEAAAGGALALLGLSWVLGSAGVVIQGLGVLALLGGAALIWSGLQRARFGRGGDGPGVVQVVEGRIAYFGPLGGGMVDVRDLSVVVLDPRGTPLHWQLYQPGQEPLSIPHNAKGAPALFDAFAALPGWRAQTALRHLAQPPDLPVTLWRKPAPRDKTAMLG